MSSLDKHDAEKIKKYIERDKYSKLKRFLSSEKIDLNEIITKKGEKMLHLAAKEGSSFCLEFLLEQGANPRLVDKKGNMPLHRALKFVIENYSNSNEKCLVYTLLTYSSKFLDVENFDSGSFAMMISCLVVRYTYSDLRKPFPKKQVCCKSSIIKNFCGISIVCPL